MEITQNKHNSIFLRLLVTKVLAIKCSLFNHWILIHSKTANLGSANK